MSDEEVKQHVEKISLIASDGGSISNGRITYTANPDNYKHLFIINTIGNFSADYSCEIDSVEDAIQIIKQFSGDPEDKIRTYFENKFHPEKQNYLHYLKDLT